MTITKYSLRNIGVPALLAAALAGSLLAAHSLAPKHSLSLEGSSATSLSTPAQPMVTIDGTTVTGNGSVDTGSVQATVTTNSGTSSSSVQGGNVSSQSSGQPVQTSISTGPASVSVTVTSNDHNNSSFGVTNVNSFSSSHSTGFGSVSVSANGTGTVSVTH